jgi:hypothetical protein
LIAEKACSMGFRSGEYGGRKKSLQSKEYLENECKDKRDLTSFLLYKLPNSFRMMDIAVIKY